MCLGENIWMKGGGEEKEDFWSSGELSRVW